jgi:hypothetical protein
MNFITKIFFRTTIQKAEEAEEQNKKDNPKEIFY